VGPGIAATLSGPLLIPPRNPDLAHARRLDWPSLILVASALAALEIGLKEAPERGWASGVVLALLTFAAGAACAFVRRTLRAANPVVELHTFADPRFATGCFLSFALGIGLFGSVYLMPVFLAFVREHGALRIGEIMLVTGIAQLVSAPVAVALERRVEARLLTGLGFAVFGIGLAASAFQTVETDFREMFWPQLLRGGAIMFCLLPPTRLALGHLPPDLVPDASGLFNLMRNLGGAIGIALIDTVLYGRAPIHAEQLVARLQSGDADTAASIGIPPELLADRPAEIDAETEALVRPLVEKAAFTEAVDEAWALVATFALLGVVAIILTARLTRRPAG
jgi:DHA2 family multidrug resistance protein